jgi:hypothetical protein
LVQWGDLIPLVAGPLIGAGGVALGSWLQHRQARKLRQIEIDAESKREQEKRDAEAAAAKLERGAARHEKMIERHLDFRRTREELGRRAAALAVEITGSQSIGARSDSIIDAKRDAVLCKFRGVVGALQICAPRELAQEARELHDIVEDFYALNNRNSDPDHLVFRRDRFMSELQNWIQSMRNTDLPLHPDDENDGD